MTGRPALLVAAMLLSTVARAGLSDEICPPLSVVDVKALTRAQVDKRICDYMAAAKYFSDESAPTNMHIVVARGCISQALNVERLYQERFARKSQCIGDGKPLDPPPAAKK